MIDKIISFGDSFMYGSDLADCDGTGFGNGKFSKLTWPALCAKELGLDYECYAQGAKGNQFISFQAIAQQFTNALVIINWSWIDRFDYFSMDSVPENSFPVPRLHTVLPGTATELSEFYYKNLHTEFGDLFRNSLFVHATHSYLKVQNIPFISSIMDTLLIDNTWKRDSAITNMQDLIRKDISWFPNNQTFLEWSRSNGYPESKGWHPLEQAHREAAKIWLPIYKEAINTYITNLED